MARLTCLCCLPSFWTTSLFFVEETNKHPALATSCRSRSKQQKKNHSPGGDKCMYRSMDVCKRVWFAVKMENKTSRALADSRLTQFNQLQWSYEQRQQLTTAWHSDQEPHLCQETLRCCFDGVSCSWDTYCCDIDWLEIYLPADWIEHKLIQLARGAIHKPRYLRAR